MMDPSYWLLVTMPAALSQTGERHTYTAQPYPIRLLTDDDARRWAALYLKGMFGDVEGQLVRDGARIPLEGEV